MVAGDLITAVLAFGGIAIAAGVIFYLCLRRTADNEHESSVSLEGRNEPVKLKMMDIEIIINDILTMYPSERLKLITDNFKQRLGKGGSGVVYKGELEDGVPVAVKVLNCNLSEQTVKQQFKAEVNSIRRTRHPNLVRLYGFCFDEGLKALVYEFMENGSLSTLLFDSKKNTITFKLLLRIAIGTAEGIAYLHEKCPQQIIHYDIKPENILLDENLSPKVSDFGLAKLCSRDMTHHCPSGFRGTPGYAAPEMWLPFAVTHKCDVYSFGMLLFEILGRRRNLDSGASNSQEWLPRYAWKKFDEGAMDELMATLQIDENDKDVATKMVMVALWCVQNQPELRPMMSSVVKMLQGAVMINRPTCPFPNLTVPISSDQLQNLSDSTTSASSASTIWITPFSREEYVFVR